MDLKYLQTLLAFSLLWLAACTPASPTASTDALSPAYTRQLLTGEAPAPTPEEAQEILQDAWYSWIYGQGVGRTALNVGTVVLFPPYALYLLGNAGLQFAGYEPLYVTDALPEQSRKVVLSGVDEITSVPGRLNAAVFREEFRDGS